VRAVTWATRFLRGDRVWVKVDPRGEPAVGADGRVDVRYKAGGKVYRAAARNLAADPAPQTMPDAEAAGPTGGGAGGGGGAGAGTGESGAAAAIPRDALYVWTDGACSGNPGPMGVGVVVLDGKERRELSEYLGVGTNNVAELTAIIRALEVCPRERTVVLHSDSSYALGLLGKGWRAKANQELVERMRTLAREFRDLRLVKVAGHAGVAENERADELARQGVTRGA
jgi:ribonuclease HI